MQVEGLDGKRLDAIWWWLNMVLLMVAPAAISAHVIFTRLIAILRDTQTGLAFSEINAQRLQVIAWAMLVLNLLDLAFGWVSTWASEASGEYFGWSFALTGWFAVLLLFVLARIFRHGAAMRDDLEGTV